MADTFDQILLRMGFDATQVEQGMLKMVAKQEVAAAKSKAIWAEADRERDASYLESVEKMIAADNEKNEAFIAADKITIEKSWANYKANVANKIATDKLYVEEYAARQKEIQEINKIGAGSGGFGWAAGGAAAGAAAGGAAEIAEGSTATLSRESMVLVREGLRGNWSRMFGSFTILLNAMGGGVKKLMMDLFGWFGIALGAVLAAGYVMFEKIKAFNKSLDEEGKLLAESIGNSTEAIKKARSEAAEGAADAAEFLENLAQKHETLVEWVDRTTAAYEKNGAALQKMIQAAGNRDVASINLAEHLGMISGSEAAAARASSSAGTLVGLEKSKLDTLFAQADVVNKARDQSASLAPRLAADVRLAEWNLNGSAAAISRNKSIAQRGNLEEQIKKQMEFAQGLADKIDSLGGGFFTKIGVAFSGGSYSPLMKEQYAYQRQLSELNEVIKKEQQLIQSGNAQYEADLAIKKAYQVELEQAKKAATENAEALLKLNADVASYSEKFKDAAIGMKELKQNLITKSLENSSEQIQLAFNSDRVTPTIEMLAGDSFMKRLNADYGSKGRFDLSSGNGPFGSAARDYELAQKQQMWDIIHGNAVFDQKGNLIGGAAFEDQQRSIVDHNMLRGAGLETPEMKMTDLVESGNVIALEIKALNALAAGKGINIADAQP